MLLVRRHCYSDVRSCLTEQRPCRGLTETVSAVGADLWLARQYDQCRVFLLTRSCLSMRQREGKETAWEQRGWAEV